MSESPTKTLIDYEFQFSSGEPIFVSLLKGRDVVEDDPDAFTITANPSKDVEEQCVIYRRQLNGYRRTTRLISDES